MSEPTALLLARADGSRVATSFTAAPLSVFDPFKDGRQVAFNGRMACQPASCTPAERSIAMIFRTPK